MDAIDSLMEEHRVIKRGLDLLEKAVLKLERGEIVDREALNLLLTFFREFADKCHHGKEEGSLFPLLEARGVPREGGPIGVMLLEHELGRGYVKEMYKVLEKLNVEESRAIFIDNALNYISLLRDHIFKEDNILFNIAKGVMESGDNEKLLEEFKSIELEKLGPGVHERLAKSLDIVEKLMT